MPNNIDFVVKEKDGVVFNEPIMITVALEEYRSLVQQVERFELLLDRANEEIHRLREERNRLLDRSSVQEG